MPVGGSSLGTASGRINIDTSDLARVASQSQQVGRQVEQNLGRMGAGAAKAQSNFAGLGKGVGGITDSFQQLDRVLGASLLIGGAMQLGRFVLDADATATAYKRQSVAALTLAGSQEKLNGLLEVYDQATGGVISKGQALADVTRLQAIGFADDAKELERFARAARGISVAMGQSQDYVISQLTLAIANQSFMRLDQIGLDAVEAQAAIDKLTAANTGLSKSMIYQQVIFEQAERKFGTLADSAAAQATGAEKAAKGWDNLGLKVGEVLGGPVSVGLNAVAGMIQHQIDLTEAWQRGFENVGRALGLVQAAPAFNVGTRSANMSSRHAPAAPARFTDDQTAIIRDHYDAITELEKNSSEQRADAVRSYGEAAASAERDYHQSSSREALDFATNRLRAEADFAQSIADLHSDAARREADQAEEFARTNARANADSAERIADARADAGEQLVELEDKYNKAREKAALDHRDKLMDAAGRLDAQAVYEEQRNFARESKDAAEAHDEQRAELGEQLAERIADEQEALAESNADRREAYERQLQDGRENDALREGEMVAEFAKRKALEDEDRALKLARAAADYAASQAEIARQHALDLERIRTEAAAERVLLKEEADKKLAAADFVNAEFDKRDRARTDAAIANWDRMGRAALAASAGQSYRAGERAAYTPTITPTPAWMTGASRDTPSSRTYVVQPGALIVNVPPSDRSIADIAVREIMEFFESLTEGQPQ